MMHIYIFNMYMLVNACIYGYIWPYILMYAPFWRPKGA